MTEELSVDQVRAGAKMLMIGIGQAPASEVMRLLKPQPEDYDIVFKPTAAAIAREAYSMLWLDPPVLAGRLQTDVDTYAAFASAFISDNPMSREFPGGYRKVGHLLQPDRIWVRFKFTEPGKPSGMAYDGLVWLDGRWGWFPKPHRYLLPVV